MLAIMQRASYPRACLRWWWGMGFRSLCSPSTEPRGTNGLGLQTEGTQTGKRPRGRGVSGCGDRRDSEGPRALRATGDSSDSSQRGRGAPGLGRSGVTPRRGRFPGWVRGLGRAWWAPPGIRTQHREQDMCTPLGASGGDSWAQQERHGAGVSPHAPTPPTPAGPRRLRQSPRQVLCRLLLPGGGVGARRQEGPWAPDRAPRPVGSELRWDGPCLGHFFCLQPRRGWGTPACRP